MPLSKEDLKTAIDDDNVDRLTSENWSSVTLNDKHDALRSAATTGSVNVLKYIIELTPEEKRYEMIHKNDNGHTLVDLTKALYSNDGVLKVFAEVDKREALRCAETEVLSGVDLSLRDRNSVDGLDLDSELMGRGGAGQSSALRPKMPSTVPAAARAMPVVSSVKGVFLDK